jgi:hypothetical protein
MDRSRQRTRGAAQIVRTRRAPAAGLRGNPVPPAAALQYNRAIRANEGIPMNDVERDQRHQANLERINCVQLVVGRGDRLRVDHEGTVLERARLMEEEISSHAATERGLAAFSRLLRVAEEGQSPHQADILCFVAAVWGGQPLPLATLRGLDQEVGDDMLAVLDAFRYARLNLVEHVEGGPGRLARLLRR